MAEILGGLASSPSQKGIPVLQLEANPHTYPEVFLFFPIPPNPKIKLLLSLTTDWILQQREANGVICINGIALTVFLRLLKFLI